MTNILESVRKIAGEAVDVNTFPSLSEETDFARRPPNNNEIFRNSTERPGTVTYPSTVYNCIVNIYEAIVLHLKLDLPDVANVFVINKAPDYRCIQSRGFVF